MSSLRIEGGHVLRPDGSVERADVLVDADAGSVVAVDEEVPPGDDSLDARGGLIMPGLVNAHTHVAMTLVRGYADDKPVDAWLAEDIWPVEAALSPEDIRAGAALGALEMIKSGTTTFCDMYFEMEEIAAVVDRAGMRARLGYGIITTGKDEDAAVEEVKHGVSIAADLDGQAAGRIRAAIMPHSLTTVEPSHFPTIVDGARKADLPIHYHANESPAFVEPIVEEFGQRPLSFAADRGLLSSGDFIAHGVHLDDEEIDRLAEHAAGVVHCPASNMKLASGMAPVEALRAADVPVGIGTDGAASNNDLDMFGELRDAALLAKLATGDASALPASAAVEMATSGGARVLNLPVGALRPGGVADLAVIDFRAPNLQPVHDHVSHLAYAATGTNVRHTICDGQVLMRDRECLTLDENAIVTEANERARALVGRAATS